MKFQVGDTVEVLDDAIKGKVTKLVGTSVFIDSEDGWLNLCASIGTYIPYVL